MQRFLNALRRAPSELLFQLDEQETCPGAPSTEEAAPVLTAAAAHLAQLCLPAGRRWNLLVCDVQEACSTIGAKDCMSLASKLCSTQRWQVRVRTAVGGAAASGSDTEVFRALRHQHLVARLIGDELQTDFIVDPAFRDTFVMPHCAPEYAALLKAVVPEVFVGPMHALVPVVECLCVEMARSFKSSGLPLPPWRRPDAMLSRWAPRKSVDIACGQGPEGLPRFSAPALAPSAMARAAAEAAAGAPAASAVAAVVTGFNESRRGSVDGDQMHRSHSEQGTEDVHHYPRDGAMHHSHFGLLSTSSSASLGDACVCCDSTATSRSESPHARSSCPAGIPSVSSFGTAGIADQAGKAAAEGAAAAPADRQRHRRRSLLSEGLLASPLRHLRGQSDMGCVLGLRSSTASSPQSSIAHSVSAAGGAQSGVLTMAPVHKGQPSICKVRVW